MQFVKPPWTFREDLARFRTGDGPQNMAIIRHTALNLLSRARPTLSLKNRRKRAGWNVDYLETVIHRVAEHERPTEARVMTSGTRDANTGDVQW